MFYTHTNPIAAVVNSKYNRVFLQNLLSKNIPQEKIYRFSIMIHSLILTIIIRKFKTLFKPESTYHLNQLTKRR